MKEIQNIDDIQGAHLSDVCFVMDYVQLGFSGSIVTVHSRPIVETSATRCRFPDAGSRDALCSLIDHPLIKVTVEAGRLMTLMFDTGKIEIPLDVESRVCGDAAEFLPGRGKPIQDY